MVITWILTIIFIIAIVSEMWFLGRYISNTQNIFHNKIFASFGLGATVYFILTFLVLFPFIWIKTSITIFAIVIFTKDFFTIIFLITRREKIKFWKSDAINTVGIIGAGILIPIFYHFGLSQWFSLKDIPLPSNKESGYNIFQTYSIWETILMELSRGSNSLVSTYIMGPITAMVLFAGIGGLYFEFTNRKGRFDILILQILTFAFVMMFNMGLKLKYFIFFPFLLMMLHHGYSVTIYSRRRYGTFFGALTIVVWTINPLTFWVIFFIGFGISLFYIISHKRRPSVFVLQIMSPMLILTALRLSYISLILSFVIFLIAFTMYSYIFFFRKIKWVEKTNFLFTYMGFIWLIVVSGIILTYAMTLNSLSGNLINAFIDNNGIFYSYGIVKYQNALNWLYYVAVGGLLTYVLLTIRNKNLLTKTKPLIYIIAIIYLIGFNPFVQVIFDYYGGLEEYAYIKLAIFPPMAIASVAYLGKFKRARL